ncbi:MAG: PAS domain S-box protein [Deltaproteobacteria bacterium]|nr:PAS domain S-box protein [Deltaproteobacteria bacterium]
MSSLGSLRAKVMGSLRAKVILGVSLILVTVMGVFTCWDMVTRIRFHLRREENKAFEFSNMVMKSIEYPMLDGEMEDVQAILESLNASEDLEIVNLHDLTGTIKYSGNPDNIGKTSQSEMTKKALRTQTLVNGLEMYKGEKILRYAMPISNERACYKCHGREKEILGVLTVGIRWTPVENRVALLRNREILLAITSLVVVGFFLIRWLSKSVTRPILQLTRLTDEISRGNLDVSFDFGKKVKCWEVMKCDKTDCPAYGKTDTLCWYVKGTSCKGAPMGEFPEKLEACRKCKVYKLHGGDEIVRLADGFSHMTSHLKASRDELRRIYDFQRNLIEGSIDGIIATDDRGNIVIFNEGAEKVLGYTSDEVIGKMDVADLYPPGRAKQVKEDLHGDRYGGSGKLVNYETTILNKAGKEVPVWLSASIIYEDENILGTVLFLRDLTERKRLEKKVLESERLATIGQGMAYISHEIKNPLMIIGGFAQQVLRKISQNGKNKEKLEIIINEIKRLEEFLSDVTDLTKLSKPKKSIANINRVVEEVSTLLEQELKAHHVAFDKSIDPHIPETLFDPKQIKQVFINIVKNAVEAMPKGGKLSIETHLNNDSIEIRIIDTGKGITPEDLKDVFDPFITTKPKGTGLGLAISRKIIEDHEGDMCIQSKLGEGTICTIILPIQGFLKGGVVREGSRF